MLGVFVTKYQLIAKVAKFRWIYSLCVLISMFLFSIKLPIHLLASLNNYVLLPLFAVLAIFFLFLERHNKRSIIERIMEYIGQRTLDIYVIHYFFIYQVHLEGLKLWFECTDNFLLSCLLALLISTIIVVLSIGVGMILHKGEILEKIMYGK